MCFYMVPLILLIWDTNFIFAADIAVDEGYSSCLILVCKASA